MRTRDWALMAVLAAGCSSGSSGVLEKWKAAGETPSAFSDAGEKLAGGKCQQGKVSGLDATLCDFSSAEAAKKAEEDGWKLVGGAVGTSVASGKTVLVLADPRKEDPSGRRINALVKAFQEQTR